MDFDGDRDGVKREDEEGTLPDNEGYCGQCEQDPQQAPKAASGHHNAAAAMGVGVHAVPMHQVLNGWCLGASNRQILFYFGFDLLSRRHGEEGTSRSAEF